MNSPISFPLLGLEVDPKVSFFIGPLEIRYYALCIAVGLILAVVYALRRKKAFGLTEDELLDGVLYIVPIAIICARLYYCAFSWDSYRKDPLSILYIWQGGLAIYGGVIGAAVSIVVYTRLRKISLPAVLDITALGFLIGQCIGRWGNFFNREAYGGVTELPWKMGLYIKGSLTYVHPTFLYESLWNLIGFLLLHFLSKKRKYDGQIALGYAAWYGFGRMFIEGLRSDSLYLGPVRISQILAAVSCLAALAVLIVNRFRPHDPEKLYANRVKKATEEKSEEKNEEKSEPM